MKLTEIQTGHIERLFCHQTKEIGGSCKYLSQSWKFKRDSSQYYKFVYECSNIS